MKSIMLSIQPQWCEKILSGEKTLELRKTAPKEIPFKAYLYCTKQNYRWSDYFKGKVIAEFIVNRKEKITLPKLTDIDIWNEFEDCLADIVIKSCLSLNEICEYATKREYIYGYYISDLKIYDTPKSLSDFVNTKGETITRAPQSWQYVELKGETICTDI